MEKDANIGLKSLALKMHNLMAQTLINLLSLWLESRRKQTQFLSSKQVENQEKLLQFLAAET